MKIERHLITRIILALCLLAVTSALAAPKTTAPEGDRFLFVVETSNAMLPFEHAGRQAVFDLIYSGVGGQIHSNDTIGVWTFGETVHAGLFPVQVWLPDQKLQLAGQVGLFVKNQHYDKQAHLDRVIQNLLPLAKAVKDVTILIVTGHDVVWKGTTFDEEINLAYGKAASEHSNPKLPLITTLVVRNGDIVRRLVTVAGEPIPLPQKTVVVNVAQTNTNGAPQSATSAIAAPPPKLPARAPVKNIIITSKKPATNREPETATAGAVTHSDALPVNTAENKTTTVAESPKSPAVPESGLSPAAVLRETGPAMPLTPPASPAPNLLGAPTPVAAGERPVTTNIAVASSANAPLTVVTPRTNAAPSLLPALLPSMPVAAREKPGATNVAMTGSTAPPLAVASPRAPEPFFTPRGFFLIGLALTACAISLFLAVRRFFRPTAQPSYITRSMDRAE